MGDAWLIIYMDGKTETISGVPSFDDLWAYVERNDVRAAIRL